MVSVVIPTYNRPLKLGRLIKSIKESDYPPNNVEIIAVNDPSPISYENIRDLYPDVIFIKNKKELLVSACRNIGAKRAQGEYIFFVDDDNVISKGCINELVKFLGSRPRVALVAPLMYLLKDKGRIWCAGIKRNYTTSLTTFLGSGCVDAGHFLKPVESEDFPNAFLVKKKIFDSISGFDEKTFPIHYEEADLAQRIRQKGYRLMLVPSAKVWHDVERITEDRGFSTPQRSFFLMRNRIIFHRKYNRFSQKWAFLIIFAPLLSVYYLSKLLDPGIKDRKSKARMFLLGIFDGFFSKI